MNILKHQTLCLILCLTKLILRLGYMDADKITTNEGLHQQGMKKYRIPPFGPNHWISFN